MITATTDMVIAGIPFHELASEALLDIRGPDESVYGDNYFENYKQRAATDMGREIHRFRKAYVECLLPEGRILDYGCGYGELVVRDRLDTAPNAEPRWWGYDLMDKSMSRLRERADREPRISEYAAVCLFDVLEHIADPAAWLAPAKAGTRLFTTIPCWPTRHDGFQGIKQWRHWKPGEHVLYVTDKGLIAFMKSIGWQLLDINIYEQYLGREDVRSFCFGKLPT